MGSFSKYKDDTHRILAWLVQTARDHGCIVKTLDYVDPIAARTGQLPKADPNAPPKKLITTIEILRIIDGLADQEGTMFIMPRLVKQSYEAAIKVRERYNDYYDKRDDKELADKQGHAHFVWVLRQLKERLGHQISVQDVARAAPGGVQPATPFVTAGLLYDMLPEPEELLDIFDDAASDTSSSSSSAASSTEEFVVKIHPEEELRLDWFMLLKSCEPLIEKIAEKWALTESTGTDRIDIAVAALLTEAAVELARQEKEKIFTRARLLNAASKLQIASEDDHLLYLPLTILRDVVAARRKYRRVPMPVLENIESAHPELSDAKSVEQGKFLVHYMLELGVECWERRKREKPPPETKEQEPKKEGGVLEQFLPRPSLDILSRYLQPVNEGQDIRFEAALSARVLLRIDTQRDKDDKKSAYQKLKGFGSAMHGRTEWYEKGKAKIGISDKVAPSAALFHLICQWVHKWPVPDVSRGIKQGMAGKPISFMEGIALQTEPDFLRLRNRALSGKLRLNLLVVWEEFTVGLCNQSVHLFCMAYLYTVLKQRGFLEGKDKQGKDLVWNSMEGMCFMHSREFFLEENPSALPTDLQRVRDRMKVSSGIDIKWILQAKKGQLPKSSKSTSRQTWDIKTSDMLEILRAYFHEKAGFLQTLYRFDNFMQADLQKNIPKANRKSYIDDFGIVAFMEKLQSYAVEAVGRTNADYMRVHLHVFLLFSQMDTKMAHVEQKLRPALDPRVWRGHNYKSWEMTDMVLQELIEAEKAEKKSKKKTAAVPPQLRLTTIAAEVLKKYMRSPGREFA